MAKPIEFIDELEAAEVHNDGEDGGEREDKAGDNMRKKKGRAGWVIEY